MFSPFSFLNFRVLYTLNLVLVTINNEDPN